MPKEVNKLEQQTENEKQTLYLNVNLKKIGEQLETLNKCLEHINWNLGSMTKLMKEKENVNN